MRPVTHLNEIPPPIITGLDEEWDEYDDVLFPDAKWWRFEKVVF